MKTIAWTDYGEPDVLIVKEVKTPLPKSNEVLVKVHASAVTAGDARIRALNVPTGFKGLTRLAFGLIKPRSPAFGMDLSGEIVAVGNKVTLFKKGDLVYGTTGMQLGANAEFICLSEKAALVAKPNNASHQEATAAIFGGLTAIHFLKEKVTLSRGQRVLINGASGAVGTAALQIANYYGANVTGICSTTNIDLVTSLGAKNTIDYTKVSLSQINDQYDVILDTVGNVSLAQSKNLLTQQGKLVLINAPTLSALLASVVRPNVIGGVAGENKAALNFLTQLIEQKKFKAVIDRSYPLEHIAEAHRYVDTGRKRGNVVINVAT